MKIEKQHRLWLFYVVLALRDVLLFCGANDAGDQARHRGYIRCAIQDVCEGRQSGQCYVFLQSS